MDKPDKVHAYRKKCLGPNGDKSLTTITKCQHFIQLQNKKRPNYSQNYRLHYQRGYEQLPLQ